MKWYKHISDSLDDPFIFDLMTHFGSDAYVVFFGTLEVYAREFKTTPGWRLQVTVEYLRNKLHFRQSTKLRNCLQYIATKTQLPTNSRSTRDQLDINSIKVPLNSGKWEVTFENDQVIIFIPKFTELASNWTMRHLQRDYVGTTAIRSRSRSIYIKKETIKKERPPEKDKIKFMDCVFLTENEHAKLKKDFGEYLTVNAIEVLNHYKMSKGKTYKSDYHALLSWALNRAKEDGDGKGHISRSHRSGKETVGNLSDDEIFASGQEIERKWRAKQATKKPADTPDKS